MMRYFSGFSREHLFNTRLPREKTAYLMATAALAFLAALLAPVPSFCAELNEYQVKAGLVLKLLNFVEWPEKSLANSPVLKICTLGTDPFSAAFASLNNKDINGKKITIRHVEEIKDSEGCHVLFIGASQRKNISRILKYVRNAPVLTVSEVEGFPEAGGMINLLIERKKPCFEVNNTALHEARLKVNPQVLVLARKVMN